MKETRKIGSSRSPAQQAQWREAQKRGAASRKKGKMSWGKAAAAGAGVAGAGLGAYYLKKKGIGAGAISKIGGAAKKAGSYLAGKGKGLAAAARKLKGKFGKGNRLVKGNMDGVAFGREPEYYKSGFASVKGKLGAGYAAAKRKAQSGLAYVKANKKKSAIVGGSALAGAGAVGAGVHFLRKKKQA